MADHGESLVIINILPGNYSDELIDKLTNTSSKLAEECKAYRFDGNATKAIRAHFFNNAPAEAECICLAVLWDEDDGDIARIVISDGKLTDGDVPRLCVTNSTIIREPHILRELNDFLFLSAQSDERGEGFVRIETSDAFVRKASFYLTSNERILNDCNAVASSPNLESYFQTDQDSMRQHIDSDTRRHPDIGPFELDYERVVRSKSFRRLVDKAQVFSASKGDHYRTRMTHTQEVTRIARRLARALGANELLTEVIALAHDMGHTPFGHQGERTLADCLMNLAREDSAAASCPELNSYGGFKHNLQTVRVLTQLERIAPDFEGLNLSWQVVEGALWHTKTPLRENCEKCSRVEKRATCCDARFFIARNKSRMSREFVQRVFHEGPYAGVKTCSLTLEGQIVALADEIAQRGHDIDDALSAGLLGPKDLVGMLLMKFSTGLTETVVQELESLVNWSQRDGAAMANPSALMRDRLVLAITNHLIDDVVKETHKRSEEEWAASWDGEHRVFSSQAVWFSKSGKLLCDYLAAVVNNRVLTSSDVSSFDERAQRIVRGLFYNYFENPRLLPQATLKRFSLVEKHNLALVARRPDLVFDLTNCTAKGMGREIEEIRNAVASFPTSTCREASVEGALGSKKLLLARIVTDYIAGMTDSYALEQHSKI